MTRSADRATRRPGAVQLPDDRVDAGETLVEIVLTIVVMGLTVGALLAALSTASRVADVHERTVRADTVVREYADAVARAAADCTAGGTLEVDHEPPAGFVVAGAGDVCPPVEQPARRTLTARGDAGGEARVEIVVRTP